MKTVLRIAKLELSLLFYSPIAWLILVVFMITIGFGYTSALSRIDFLISYGSSGIAEEGVTFKAFSTGTSGFLQGLLKNTGFFIPILTMGLISKEVSSGSIKLVQSSPIKPFQWVIGKYFAVVIYCFLLTACLMLLVGMSIFTMDEPDISLMLAAVASFFLLAITYAAVGLFVSSLTAYQIVAAIGTLLLILGLNSLANMGQDIPLLRDVTHWFGMEKRASTGALGLYSSATIFYYFIIIVLFLGFTTIKINSSRKTLNLVNKIKPYFLLLVGAGILGYLSTRSALVKFKDFSAIQYETISNESEDILKEIDGSIKITTYVNVLDEKYWLAQPSRYAREYDHFEKYRRYIPQLEMEYVYFYDTIVAPTKTFITNRGKSMEALANKSIANIGIDPDDLLSPDEIKQIIDLSEEDNRFIRTIEYNGEMTFLRMYDDDFNYPYEAIISASIKRLIVKPPKVIFVTGHKERTFMERSDNDYYNAMAKKRYRFNLVNYGFDFDEVNLNTHNIPEDTDILVIADPVTPYSQNELEKISNYLNNGGNAFILGEPDHRTAIDPVVELLGIQFEDGLLMQENGTSEPEQIMSHFNEGISTIIGNSKKVAAGMKANQFDKEFFTPTAMAINTNNVPADYEISSVLGVDEEKTQIKTDSVKKPITAKIGVALAKKNDIKEEQRILIFGDADMINNIEHDRKLGTNTIPPNGNIANIMFRWLSSDMFPVDIANKGEPKDQTLKIDKSGIDKLKTLLVFIVPLLIAIIGAIIIRRRSTK